MGLDTTHECWHGSYSAFNRWRDTLAEVSGYTFHRNEHGQLMVDLDWGNAEATIGENLMGKWPRMPMRPDGTKDPLIVLLAHSDCEGEIQTRFCGPLADRLEELLPKLEGIDRGGHVGLMTEKTQTFIDGLRRAAAAGESVEFH